MNMRLLVRCQFGNTRLHILLVDDDTELCELLAEFLENDSFQVSSCHDGFSALEAFAERSSIQYRGVGYHDAADQWPRSIASDTGAAQCPGYYADWAWW